MNDNLERMRNSLKEKNTELSKSTCCFTGHRPQKLPWGFNEDEERCIEMKRKLKQEIINSIKNGYINFITGMILGFDMICAEMDFLDKFIFILCSTPFQICFLK